MAFKFRLQSVLFFRTSLEEKAQLALSREQRLLEDYRQRLQRLQDERQAMMADLEQRKQGAMAASLYALYVEGLLGMEREIAGQADTVAGQGRVVEDCRQELARRMQDRKVMDRLKEKDYRLFIAETLKREQKQSDEQAILRYGKGRM
ncbi:MAG: flagellar export protein FliJ [Deltaproteobacteria bacterium CG_4_10_14_3_um_filter_60_8]|nr:MAG: flagellar export protein FliJ [Desulfobacterales bacterium CG2_30_60_27]PIP43078.1 MAG: flagellar export protein FliJ [Deltaproteobacteria bacterium CG23_combo_of_CG06-09_8_20_14_all_60_8]PIY25147.1 MAG: flagellar export protein FliJ [Deltaproteobacteria bacterium CG_4_10_14_3_um_filter_60_8]